jgi:hypothetical protein
MNEWKNGKRYCGRNSYIPTQAQNHARHVWQDITAGMWDMQALGNTEICRDLLQVQKTAMTNGPATDWRVRWQRVDCMRINNMTRINDGLCIAFTIPKLCLEYQQLLVCKCDFQLRYST